MTVTCTTMTFLYLVIGVFLHQLSPILATSRISGCSFDYNAPEDGESNLNRSFKGVADVVYERSELAIYSYDHTEFVNVLLHDVKIELNGVSAGPNEKNADFSLSLQTDIEGVAFINKTEAFPLTKCDLDLRTNIKYRKDLPVNLQNQIVELVRSCIQPKLCAQLGEPQEDDYIRARIVPYDFKQNSVMNKVLRDKYPNLCLIDERESSASHLQTAINGFVDFWLASALSKLSDKPLGRIILPDVNETMDGIPLINKGYFRLYNGTFGNLRNVMRSEDFILTHTGLQFSVIGGFQIPQSLIHYNHFALKYGVLDTDGKIDININGIEFNIRVDMNYNTSPCQIAVTQLKSKFDNLDFHLTDSSAMEGLINDIISTLVNKFTRNLLSFIEVKLKGVINDPLSNFNCENFRP